jgi:WD40 repeat protein
MSRANPYVGLVPYDEQDAEWFFGREIDTEIVGANLRASRVTVLYGASGVGKSSLLLAGMVPSLKELVATHREAVAAAPPSGGAAVIERPPFAVTVFRDWKDPPLPRLAEAVRVAVEKAAGVELPRPEDAESLVAAFRGYCKHVRTLLIVLDQFEEYFTYHGDETGPESFGEELVAVVTDPDVRVNVMFSLREDALSKLDRFSVDIPDLLSNCLRIEYLDHESAYSAVEEPVKHYNTTRADGEVRIQPELIEQVLHEVRTGQLALTPGQTPTEAEPAPGHDAGNRIETPYLQLVMEQLWTAGTDHTPPEITLDTLARLGGADEIVSRHLTGAMDELTPQDQDVAADLFEQLVTPSKTKIAHLAEDLAKMTKHDPAAVRRVLKSLASGKTRILRAVPPPGQEYLERYELYHDVLAEAVLEWSHRRQHERALSQRRRERTKRMLRLAAVLASALALFGILLLLFLQSQEEADRADTERSNAFASASFAELDADPERSILLALEGLEVEETPRALRALRDAVAASHVVAAFAGGKPKPCGEPCEPTGDRRTKLTPVLRKPALTSAARPGSEPDVPARARRFALAPDGRAIAVIRRGAVHLWRPVDGSVAPLEGVDDADQVAFIGAGRSLLVLTTDSRALIARADGTAPPRELMRGVRGAAASADGQYVAVQSGNGVTVVPTSGGPRRQLPTGRLDAVSFSPADPGLLLAAGGGRLDLWQWRTGERRPLRSARDAATSPELTPAPAPAAIQDAGFSADGRLVIASVGETIRAWRVSSREREFSRVIEYGWSAGTDTSGSRILTVDGNVATIRSATKARPLQTLGGHSEAIQDAAFSPDGELVATGGADGARVWDARSGASLTELRAAGRSGRVSAIEQVEFTPDGAALVTTDEDGVTRIWDAMTGAAAPAAAPTAAAFAPDDSGHVLIARRNGAVQRWNPATNSSSTVLDPSGRAVYSTSFAASVVAQVEFDDIPPRLFVRDLGTGRRVPIPMDFPFSATLSADGSRLLASGFGRPRLWDLSSRRPRRLELTAGRNAYAAAISDGGERVLIIRGDGTGRIVDTDQATEARKIGGPTLPMIGGDFDPEGDRLVTYGGEHAIVWDTRTGTELVRLTGHFKRVTSAAFSPDGERIVTGGEDRRTQLWRADDGAPIAVLSRHGTSISGVELDRSERHVLFTGEAGSTRVIPCIPCQPRSELLAEAKERVTRELRESEIESYVGTAGDGAGG